MKEFYLRKTVEPIVTIIRKILFGVFIIGCPEFSLNLGVQSKCECEVTMLRSSVHREDLV